MFCATDRKDHGLTHDPFKAIVTPRPIGWITSRSAKGEINLAPYSYFNGMSSRPPVVCFSSEGRKDSLTFIEETGEFVCNLATYDLRLAVNETSAPYPRGDTVCSQRHSSAQAPCARECRWLQTVSLRDIEGRPLDNHVVFGQVVGVYIDDRFLKHGRLDTAAMKPLARCGYADYAIVDAVFAMPRPTAPANAEGAPTAHRASGF